MHHRNVIATILGFACLAAIIGCSAEAGKVDNKQPATKLTAEIGKPAPDFTLVDATGKERSLSDYEGKHVVLEWVNFGCPFVKKHYNSDNMQTLQANYIEKDVVWLSICSSAPGKQGFYEGEELATMISESGSHATAYLKDDDGTVGKLYNAKTTPNMFIINPDGFLVYAGAIDDKPSTNPADIEHSMNYVTAAMTSSMAGEEVAVTTSVPYGCSVKY